MKPPPPVLAFIARLGELAQAWALDRDLINWLVWSSK
jgi:hypothetical protein